MRLESSVSRFAPSLLVMCAALVACTAVGIRPIESGPEGDPLCSDRVGTGGFDCPPAMPGVEPGPSVSVGAQPGAQNLREVALSDLYALQAQQGAYFRLYAEYSKFLQDLDFDSSAGVSMQILRATDGGWSAIARVRSLQLECAIFVGVVTPPRPYASREGVADCAR